MSQDARYRLKQVKRILKEKVNPIDKLRRIHCHCSLWLDKVEAGPRIRPAKVRLNIRLGHRNPGPYSASYPDLDYGWPSGAVCSSSPEGQPAGSSPPKTVRKSDGQAGHSNGPWPAYSGTRLQGFYVH